MTAPDYLDLIRNANVYDVAIKSPLEVAANLSARTGNRVLMKREDLQPVFSFKLRGAYNKMHQLAPAQRERGVVAASAGNHAQGLAMAAQRMAVPATIVMPRTTPPIKVDAVRMHGAKAVLHGDSYDEAYAHATKLAERCLLEASRLQRSAAQPARMCTPVRSLTRSIARRWLAGTSRFVRSSSMSWPDAQVSRMSACLSAGMSFNFSVIS